MVLYKIVYRLNDVIPHKQKNGDIMNRRDMKHHYLAGNGYGALPIVGV